MDVVFFLLVIQTKKSFLYVTQKDPNNPEEKESPKM